MFFRKHKQVARLPSAVPAPSGVTLLDVRSPEEFAQGHLEGAINIPVQELAERLGELRRGTPISVYCRSGRRSAAAAELLTRAGFGEVHDRGGWSG
jgi:phage shock protein E